MTPKNKLFIGILAFMLIVNILVIFNLNYLYIRAILAFVFLITVPGLLIMLCLKVRKIGFWEYLVYTVGLSVAFIMFAGLAVNWILPWLNVTDKPLQLMYILPIFDMILLALWLIAHKRNEDLSFKPKLPKFSWLDRIFIIIPMFFPFMAVIGAFLLNNHGTNIVTMIMLGSIAVYVFCVVLFRNKLNENVYPWAILMIGLAILFSISMRSWFVSGIDMNLEYSLFKSVKENRIWTLYSMGNNYDSMLSITIFPTILSLFIQISGSFLLKLFFPLIFIFIPLIIYLTCRIFFNNITCFLAAFFFMSQSSFVTWTNAPIRQEIAFLFFSIMLLVLFTKEMPPTLKKVLFFIFGFSMILSHYTTSYIALAIFLLAYIMLFVYKKWENRKIKKGKLKTEERTKFYLTGVIVLLFLLFGFLWYNQVTPTSNGLIDFMHKSADNFGDFFNEELQAKGSYSLTNPQISKQINYIKELEDYSSATLKNYNNANTYSLEEYQDYPTHPKFSEGMSYNINYLLANNLYLFWNFFRLFFSNLIIVLGTLYLILNIKQIPREYAIILLASLIIICVLAVIPFVTINYDLMRTHQQILILLSVSEIFGFFLIFKNFQNQRFLLISFFLIIYFLFLSGFFGQLIGGNIISLRMNNFGGEYDSVYAHNSEYYSGSWLNSNRGSSTNINLDNRANSRLYLSNLVLNLWIDTLPPAIGKNNYVYSSYTNTKKEITFKTYKGNVLSFSFPTKFLNNNKNKIYNNGDSEIYK